MKVYFHLGTHLKCAGTVAFILLASFLCCILTSLYDIECINLCNTKTTSLFPVSGWAAIPKLKKKQKNKKNKNSWKKNNWTYEKSKWKLLPVRTCLLVSFFVTKYSQSDGIDHIFVLLWSEGVTAYPVLWTLEWVNCCKFKVC